MKVCTFLPYRGPRSACAPQHMDAVEYRAGLNWQMPDPHTFYYCRHRSMIQVIHKADPSLTVRLSQVLCSTVCLCASNAVQQQLYETVKWHFAGPSYKHAVWMTYTGCWTTLPRLWAIECIIIMVIQGHCFLCQSKACMWLPYNDVLVILSEPFQIYNNLKGQKSSVFLLHLLPLLVVNLSSSVMNLIRQKTYIRVFGESFDEDLVILAWIVFVQNQRVLDRGR